MAEDKKGFILYADQSAIVGLLSDEQAGLLFKHVYRYVNDEFETDLDSSHPDPMVNLAFQSIKMQLKRDLKKYENKKVANSENGRIGNLKRWNIDLYNSVITETMTIEEAEKIAKRRKVSPPDVLLSPPIAKIADKGNDTDNGNDNDNDINNNNTNVLFVGDSEKSESQPQPQKSKIDLLKERELKFMYQVNQEIDIPPETRESFILYWTEPNKSKSKMKFEMESTWDLKRRLSTWMKNEYKFKQNTTTNQTQSGNGSRNPNESKTERLERLAKEMQEEEQLALQHERSANNAFGSSGIPRHSEG